MSDARRTERATSFGQQAAAYDRGRPEYPAEAVAWMLGDARQVVDIGAGTGKLTRAIAASGHEVVAVDPDALMLATLASRAPGIVTHVGTAEHLPLPESSADAVVFGQAWHWVDPIAASREAGRVLRPDGVLGLIWNIRDVSEPWVRELVELMDSSAAETLVEGEGPRVAEPFGELDSRRYPWMRQLSVDDLVEMVASRSTTIAASAGERDAILAGVRQLGDRVSDGRGALHLPYVTHVFRALVVS